MPTATTDATTCERAAAEAGTFPATPTRRAPPRKPLESGMKLLPDAISLIGGFGFLSGAEREFVGQIQGRTYLRLYGAFERLVDTQPLEFAARRRPPERIGFDAPVVSDTGGLARQTDLRRLESRLAERMPAGYSFVSGADGVARAVRRRSRWAVCAFATALEFFAQRHYCEAAMSDAGLSPHFNAVLFRGRSDEDLHATVAEMEWNLQNKALMPEARNAAVDAFIELIEAVDGALQAQARADTRYFAAYSARAIDRKTLEALVTGFRSAYRWQYLLCGMRHPRFAAVMAALTTPDQFRRIAGALDGLG